MRNLLSSNEDVTVRARNDILLKFKSLTRRKVSKMLLSSEEKKQQLHTEVQQFASIAGAGDSILIPSNTPASSHAYNNSFEVTDLAYSPNDKDVQEITLVKPKGYYTS